MNDKKIVEAIEYLKVCIKSDEEILEEVLTDTSNKTLIKATKELISYKRTAIEALEKQLSKKVEKRTEYKDFHGHLICYKGFCPSCGMEVESNRNNSCHKCTQMLDWSK